MSLTFVASGYVPFLTPKGNASTYTHIKSTSTSASSSSSALTTYHLIPHRNWTFLARSVKGVGVSFPKAAFKKLTASDIKWHDPFISLNDLSIFDDKNDYDKRMTKSLHLLNTFLLNSLQSHSSITTFLETTNSHNSIIATGLKYGQYFATPSTCSLIVSHLSTYLNNNKFITHLTVMEPSCGTGELLTGGDNSIIKVLSEQDYKVHLKCIDLDETVLSLCKDKLKDVEFKVEFTNCNFLEMDVEDFEGDCITICGPPYDSTLPNQFIEKLTKEFKIEYGIFILPVRLKGLVIEGYEVKEIGDVEEFVGRGGRTVKQVRTSLRANAAENEMGIRTQQLRSNSTLRERVALVQTRSSIFLRQRQF